MDMFYSRFKKEGILNSETGKSYRTFILETGGSKVPISLLIFRYIIDKMESL